MSRQAQAELDTKLRHRINAGRVAVRNQIAFFGRQFGEVTSEWKEDDTRVTFADFAISEKLFAELRREPMVRRDRRGVTGGRGLIPIPV